MTTIHHQGAGRGHRAPRRSALTPAGFLAVAVVAAATVGPVVVSAVTR